MWANFVQNQSIFSDFLKMIHFAQFLPEIGSKFNTACFIVAPRVLTRPKKPKIAPYDLKKLKLNDYGQKT